MRIGVDIDGVLTDIEKFQLDYGSKFFYENYNKCILNYKGYNIKEIFGVGNDIYKEFWSKYLFEYATDQIPRKFSSEIIKRLKDEQNEIYIITARTLTDQNTKEGANMREIVTKWLDANKIYYDKLIFSPDNKLITCIDNNIDLMIEDSGSNIKSLSTIIPVICFDARYNEELSGENIIRCYSWYDIYYKINELKHILK